MTRIMSVLKLTPAGFRKRQDHQRPRDKKGGCQRKGRPEPTRFCKRSDGKGSQSAENAAHVVDESLRSRAHASLKQFRKHGPEDAEVSVTEKAQKRTSHHQRPWASRHIAID